MASEILFELASISLAVHGDGRLLDLCDEHRVPIDFACRGASCATCLVQVTEGAEFLAPAESTEIETLEHLARGVPAARLACQVVIAGAGRVRLRVVSPRRGPG